MSNRHDAASCTVRFAPSPNGPLHLGHARSALLNWHFAQARGGGFLLRMEDIDAARCTPGFEAGICDDLAWLGLSWPEPVRRQSEHFEAYGEALAELRHLGLVYPAFLSRAEIARCVQRIEAEGRHWPRDPDGAPQYPGDERTLPEAERRRGVEDGRPFAWRLDMARALAGLGQPISWREGREQGDGPVETVNAFPETWGDVVLARADTPTSYHLSVTVDDHLQGITDVIRGDDLFESTSVHRLLQMLLAYRAPIYRHHRLVTDADGRKLSKSSQDTALAALRSTGVTQAGILAMAGFDPAL